MRIYITELYALKMVKINFAMCNFITIKKFLNIDNLKNSVRERNITNTKRSPSVYAHFRPLYFDPESSIRLKYLQMKHLGLALK